jgi:hypothetical protein
MEVFPYTTILVRRGVHSQSAAFTVEAMILTGEPVVFRAGTATILGEFQVVGQRLRIELAQIEGGGESVSISIWALARKFAQLNQLTSIELLTPSTAPSRT